jgi:outer membrane protein assembly factor BamB
MSILICAIMVASISSSITQKVGEPSSGSSKTVALTLSNISAPIPQIVGQPTSSLSGTGGLADSPWPMFRQNLNHTGVSPYDTSANPGKLKWSFETDSDVHSSPTIGTNGTIYVGSDDNKLYAINPDGTEKWNFTTGGNVESSPAIGSDGTIYVGSYDNKLYAINPDGTEKWDYTIGGEIMDSSPAIGPDGTIYIGCYGDYKLYAINPDGTEKWSFSTGSNVRSSPAIGSDGTIYIGSGDSKLYAINPNGTKKWSCVAPGFVFSSPAIGCDGAIYVGSGMAEPTFHAINPNGTKKWSFNTGSTLSPVRVFSSPAIGSDGTIYFGTHPWVYALNPDGTEKWKFTTGNTVDSSPAIGFDGTIYVGSENSKVYAINPDGTEKWNFTTSDWIFSSPAIGSDGTIYVGSHDGKLYAIGTPTTNQPPVADACPNQIVNEGDIVQLDGSASYDPDGTIETYEWDFESDGIYDYIETTNSPSDGTFDGKTTHIYGDNGLYMVTLRVTDDSSEVDTDTSTVTVTNIAPTITPFGPFTVSEGSPFTLSATSTDPGSDDLTFTWTFEYGPTITNVYYNDGTGPDPYPSPGGIFPFSAANTVGHTYGDDGVSTVTLTVDDDDDGISVYKTNITVSNVNPTVTIESVTMNAEIGLRVAGRKHNNVNMTLYEDGNPIGNVSIERMPGSPNEQMAWIPISINFSKSYTATVIYTPEDPPNVGANPVWIFLKSKDGTIKKIHHTFNVQQSKKRDSDHWNHVEPWEVDLNDYFIGLTFEITSNTVDPGSDDLTLTYTYGSQVKTVTYLNNPPVPDPYPSPEVNPRDIMDTTTLIYEGPGTVMLVVKDDDNIRLGVGEGSDYFGIG